MYVQITVFKSCLWCLLSYTFWVSSLSMCNIKEVSHRILIIRIPQGQLVSLWGGNSTRQGILSKMSSPIFAWWICWSNIENYFPQLKNREIYRVSFFRPKEKSKAKLQHLVILCLWKWPTDSSLPLAISTTEISQG